MSVVFLCVKQKTADESAACLVGSFLFKRETAFEVLGSLVGSGMCIRDRSPRPVDAPRARPGHCFQTAQGASYSSGKRDLDLIPEIPGFRAENRELSGSSQVAA